jgi:pyridoxine 5'-phosphate synthase PdxJ
MSVESGSSVKLLNETGPKIEFEDLIIDLCHVSPLFVDTKQPRMLSALSTGVDSVEIYTFERNTIKFITGLSENVRDQVIPPSIERCS